MRHIVTQLSPVVECLELARRLGEVQGAMGAVEGYVLHMLAERGPGLGEIVIVGSRAARAACYLAEGSRRAGRELVTVVGRFLVPTAGRANALGRTAEGERDLSDLMNALSEQSLDDWARPVVADSSEAAIRWTRPIRLLLFAGADAEEARLDFDRWATRLIRHGLAAFLADQDPLGGPGRIAELIASDRRFEDRLSVGALRVAERV